MAQWFPWNDLPVDVLPQILDLFEIPDLICLSLVCTSFKRVVYRLPKLKNHSRYPWVMLEPSMNPCNEVPEISDKYYSLSEDKIYEIKLENPFRSWRPIESSYGWLIMADDESNLHLINPITKRHIALPPIITTEGISPIVDHKKNLLRYNVRGFGKIEVSELRSYYTKVVLSRDPSEGEFIVMFVCVPRPYQFDGGRKARVSFVKKGDKSWTLLDKTTNYHDFVFHDGLFYGATELGGIDALDLSGSPSPKIKTVVPDFVDHFDSDSLDDAVFTKKYIVVTPQGRILVLMENYTRRFEIRVYKVDIQRGIMIEIFNLGDNSIFLGPNSGSFCTKKSPTIESNCVFFVSAGRVGIYDLIGRSCSFEAFGNLVPLDWITPSLN